MKTYASVVSFETALKSGKVEVHHVVGAHKDFIYFLGEVLGENQKIIRVGPL